MKDLRKQRNEKAAKAGWGTWFRNTDDAQVFVEVRFYPKTKLYLIENDERREITKAELETNYHRLRL